VNRTRRRSHSRSRRTADNPPPHGDGPAEPTHCWYHRRFRDKARKCIPTYSFREQKNWKTRRRCRQPPELQLPADSSPTRPVNRDSFYIPVRTFAYSPASSLQGARTASNMNSSRPTGPPFPSTKGSTSASSWGYAAISPGASWRPKSRPPSSVWTYSPTCLLVDYPNNRLLDGTTSLSAPARIAHTLTPSVKSTGGGAPVDNLTEFRARTRPTGIQREVRHDTVHHIRTTPGSPVTRRQRRQAPDRLAMPKA
jgi:hypothetical protein